MYNSVFIVLYFNYNKPLNKTSQCVRNLELHCLLNSILIMRDIIHSSSLGVPQRQKTRMKHKCGGEKYQIRFLEASSLCFGGNKHCMSS